MKLRIKYDEILPPLTDRELEGLKADIEENGLLVQIVIDEDKTILDGHHRYKALGETVTRSQVRKVVGLSESEKLGYVLSSAMANRNMSPTQTSCIRSQITAIAKTMAAEGLSQRDIARRLRVNVGTVCRWLQGVARATENSSHGPENADFANKKNGRPLGRKAPDAPKAQPSPPAEKKEPKPEPKPDARKSKANGIRTLTKMVQGADMDDLETVAAITELYEVLCDKLGKKWLTEVTSRTTA